MPDPWPISLFSFSSFFLVSTVIFQDQGIAVKLPPHKIDQTQVSKTFKDYLSIHINPHGEVMIDHQLVQKHEISKQVSEFLFGLPSEISTSFNSEHKALKLNFSKQTDYTDYLFVYNEMLVAYGELRDALAMAEYGEEFMALSKSQRAKLVKAIPIVIVEEMIDPKQS